MDDFPRPGPLSGEDLKTDITLESKPDLQWPIKYYLGDLPGNGNISECIIVPRACLPGARKTIYG